MTPEQERILAKLRGRLKGHVVPMPAPEHPWTTRRIKGNLSLMLRRIGPYHYAQIWRYDPRRPVAGVYPPDDTHPVSRLADLIADFDRTVNAELLRQFEERPEKVAAVLDKLLRRHMQFRV